VAKKTTTTKEQLAECKDEVAALKHELAECQDTVESVQPLLKNGLRLALENAALRDQVTGLIQEKTETNAESEAETSPTQ
jgi:hypothetical protein